MSTKTREAAIEAILFAAGEAVETERIADAVGADVPAVIKTLEEMEERYRADDRGIALTRLDDSWQLCTKNEYYEELIRLEINVQKPHLTEVMMEVLAIIAYKQPVTRLEIEKIRGVRSDHAVNRLIEYDLVEEVGRLDAPGRPILLGTTKTFLRHFGMQSAKELPEPDPVKVADLEGEAEEEILQKIVD